MTPNYRSIVNELKSDRCTRDHTAHFKRDDIMCTLRGGVPKQIPYQYFMPEKYKAKFQEWLGCDPSEIFHTASWYRLVLIKYEGAELWDTEEQRYEQSPEEFGMLRDRFRYYLPEKFPAGSRINPYGVVTYHPSGMMGHLRAIINPLANVRHIKELEDYPFPDAREDWRWKGVAEKIKRYRSEDIAVMGGVPLILEDANFLRGMEQNLIDMAEDNEIGRWIWKRLGEDRLYQAQRFADMGVDIIGFGDHLATQRGSLFSREMFRKWIVGTYEPIVREARLIKPDLVFAWHTDGKNDDFIYDDLLSIGVSIFNPVEADCENPHALKDKYGDRIVLWGTFSKLKETSSPDELWKLVEDRMKLAKRHGGIILGGIGGTFENCIAYNLAAEKLGRV